MFCKTKKINDQKFFQIIKLLTVKCHKTNRRQTGVYQDQKWEFGGPVVRKYFWDHQTSQYSFVDSGGYEEIPGETDNFRLTNNNHQINHSLIPCSLLPHLQHLLHQASPLFQIHLLAPPHYEAYFTLGSSMNISQYQRDYSLN